MGLASGDFDCMFKSALFTSFCKTFAVSSALFGVTAPSSPRAMFCCLISLPTSSKLFFASKPALSAICRAKFSFLAAFCSLSCSVAPSLPSAPSRTIFCAKSLNLSCEAASALSSSVRSFTALFSSAKFKAKPLF